jgi:hypothetical protein
MDLYLFLNIEQFIEDKLPINSCLYKGNLSYI